MARTGNGLLQRLLAVSEEMDVDRVDGEVILRLALDVVEAGVWVWEFEDKSGARDVLRWNNRMHQIYGTPPFEGGATKLSYWEALCHPEDLKATEDALMKAKDSLEFKTSFRIIRPNGDVRKLLARARVFRDDTGEVMKMIGVNIDITGE